MDGYVLAGGFSRRMGADKARLPWLGPEPLAVSIARRVAAHCSRVTAVRRGPPDGLPWPGLRVIRDEAPPQEAHPLFGLAAALEDGRSPLVFVCPTDAVGLTEAAMATLIDINGPCIAVSEDGRQHPLVGMFAKSDAARALDWARQGRSVRDFVRGVRAVTLPNEALHNLNRWPKARPHPDSVLRAWLADLPPDSARRALRSEMARRRAAGIVVPEYNQPPPEV